MNRYSERG